MCICWWMNCMNTRMHGATIQKISVDLNRRLVPSKPAGLKRHIHFSVNLNDFTVWHHTWRKTWVNCAVHSGNPTSSSVYLPTPRWHHLKAHPFLAIHSADVHRMVYYFSNTTSYCTFYAFFSSFRITLWRMWLANSKRHPCFYPPQSHAQEDTHRTDKADGKLVLCKRTFSSVFRAVFFYTVKLHSLIFY